MAKVTSKGQVTIPKAIAVHYRIGAGDEVEFVAAGDAIRVIPPGTKPDRKSTAERLALFDAATDRQLARQREGQRKDEVPERGWNREDLYHDGGTD